MLFHTDRTFTVLVFQLLLTHSCRGQPQVIGSSQPIVAMLGDDTILPCHLEPAESAVAMTLEWARRDLDPRFVHLWRSGQELVIKKHKTFEGRTSMFVSELRFGNISLKLSKVKLTDQGRYRCFIPGLERDAYVQLVVGAASSAAVSLAGINKTTNGVMLQCESEGWYPEPDLLWLDAEGNLLSAGPPETLRGPDDLYTVSSRVTVDKRDNTTFTCRVQQKDTNQTRETHIHVPDEFFQLQSAASITGLAVSLAVCIVFILLLVVWMGWRQNKTKRRHSAGTDEEEKRKNQSKTNRPDDQITVETEGLMTSGIQMEESEGNVQKEKNFFQKMTSMQPFWKQQRREEELQRWEQELQRREQELQEEQRRKEEEREEQQRREEQQNMEEQQRREEELQRWEQELQRREEELQEEQRRKEEEREEQQRREEQQNMEEQQRREEVAKEVQELKDQVETLQNELDTKRAELQKINEEELSSDNELQTPKEELEKKKNILQKRPFQKKKEELKKELKEANQELEKTNKELKEANQELKKTNKELKQANEKLEKTNKELKEANEELEKTKSQLKIKDEEISKLNRELEKKLREEETKMEQAEPEVENQMKDLNIKPEDDGSQQDDSSSTTGPGIVIEADQRRKHIRLINESHENQQLEGWKLEMEVNGKTSIYTFENSIELKSGKPVTIFQSGSRLRSTDLKWKDLIWNPEDTLKFTLVNDTDHTRHQLNYTKINK